MGPHSAQGDAQEREVYDNIGYWAPTQSRQVEVDFLLSRGNDWLALEVKASSRFSRSWLAGLKASKPCLESGGGSSSTRSSAIED